MKITTVLILLIISNLTYAKDTLIESIDKGFTALEVCQRVEEGDTVTIDSEGGNLGETIQIIKCLRQKKVSVKVIKAKSAASMLVLSLDKVCLGKNAVIGFHSAYDKGEKGEVIEWDLSKTRQFYIGLGEEYRLWGYSLPEIYLIIGMSVMAPPDHMTYMPRGEFIKLLGERYIGTCN